MMKRLYTSSLKTICMLNSPILEPPFSPALTLSPRCLALPYFSPQTPKPASSKNSAAVAYPSTTRRTSPFHPLLSFSHPLLSLTQHFATHSSASASASASARSHLSLSTQSAHVPCVQTCVCSVGHVPRGHFSSWVRIWWWQVREKWRVSWHILG